MIYRIYAFPKCACSLGTILMLAVASAVAPALAQPSASPSQSKAVRATVSNARYDSGPFDASINSLPRNYSGHNVEDIAGRIKPPPSKGEFEKTAEFELRMHKWAETPVVGTFRPMDDLAIVVNDGLFEEYTRYDADSEKLLISISLPSEDHIQQGAWLPTKSGFRLLGIQRATTMLGVKFDVSRFETTSLGIAIEGGSSFDFSIQMTRDVAKIIKPLLRAVIVVQLVEPYVLKLERTKSASLKSPTQGVSKYTGLVGKVKDVIVYNSNTGDIILRKSTYDLESKRVEERSKYWPSRELSNADLVGACVGFDWPAASIRAGVSGATIMKFTFDDEGKYVCSLVLSSADPSREHRLLDRIAMEAMGTCIDGKKLVGAAI